MDKTTLHGREARNREARNQQNEHIIASGHIVRACVAWLIAHGYTVLGYAVENRRPVVTIQHSPLCEQLGGAQSVQRPHAGAMESVMVAVVQGCQVQWTVMRWTARSVH